MMITIVESLSSLNEIKLPDGEYSRRNRKGVRYLNLCASFDIETSSFYQNNQKCAAMYAWAVDIEGQIVIGRTWSEFEFFLDKLRVKYGLDEKNRLIIYVHNLSYEFQFIRQRFYWLSVFASEVRKTIYAVTVDGIEFRCSLFASGYSLETLAEQIQTVNKKVGDLDYSLIRHSETPLSDKEIGYIINDVKIVVAWIRSELEEYKYPHRIPITKTGKVRRLCRKKTLYGYDSKQYKKLMSVLTLTPELYLQLKRGFMGGFTHANPCRAMTVIDNVHSMDLTSDYPAQMVMHKYPMGAPEKITIKNDTQFRENIKKYCCLFDVQFIGLKSKILYENYLSRSRCRAADGETCVNGRIASANMVITTVTEQDFYIIEKCYTWQKMRVCNFHRFKKNYLPRSLLEAVLELYADKSKLKGVESRHKEYTSKKELLNSCYGMLCTDIIRSECSYTDHWVEKLPDLEEEIDKYNVKNDRFQYYPWGVWVTAYARRTLWAAILHLQQDYIYSDTDSVKFTNYDKHKDYFDRYNRWITERLNIACQHIGLNPELCRPKSSTGKIKQLGVWDYEGCSEKFKTLGAKRYLALKDGKLHLTAAGINKEKGSEYLAEFNDPFEQFNDELTVDAEHTKKLTHTYIDERRRGQIIDYLGNPGYFDEKSAVHLEPAIYTLSVSQFFINYINSIKEESGGI